MYSSREFANSIVKIAIPVPVPVNTAQDGADGHDALHPAALVAAAITTIR